MNKNRYVGFVLCLFSFVLCLFSCDPRAKWETEEVEIQMNITTVSAGYVECSFSTNKDAYYLVAIEPVRPDYDPMAHQKQFMTLALDSANAEYIQWRYDLLSKGEFSIAPFASHSLQYGSIDHFFTGLTLGTEYWIYAFVVNPETMKPAGKLYLEKVETTYSSIVPIRFEYRVKGDWDYAYPIDSVTGHINSHFPYVAITMDSLEIRELLREVHETKDTSTLYYYANTAQEFFVFWLYEQFRNPGNALVRYGVSVVENDGISSRLFFLEDHTYYTFIGGYDFSFAEQMALYKFRWHYDYTHYFTNKENIAYDFDLDKMTDP